MGGLYKQLDDYIWMDYINNWMFIDWWIIEITGCL